MLSCSIYNSNSKSEKTSNRKLAVKRFLRKFLWSYCHYSSNPTFCNMQWDFIICKCMKIFLLRAMDACMIIYQYQYKIQRYQKSMYINVYIVEVKIFTLTIPNSPHSRVISLFFQIQSKIKFEGALKWAWYLEMATLPGTISSYHSFLCFKKTLSG